MSKATTKKTAKVETKTSKKFTMPNWSNVWKNIVEIVHTVVIAAKVMGVGAAAAYLIQAGMSRTDVVYVALGAVLAGYAIVVFVSVAHFAVKAKRA